MTARGAIRRNAGCDGALPLPALFPTHGNTPPQE